MSKNPICSIDTTIFDATTPGQSGFGKNDNERVIYIPQNSRNGASPSDCLVSYPGHSLRVLVIYRDAADWVGSKIV